MDDSKYITIRNAKVHNLKGVSLKIPRGKLVVVTGLSGSGKSSLAFDTIFAEAQRRYMDTLSPYAKHFIGVMERPDVESIEGLSPTISIEQKSTNRNPRSTVGTITEISDFLRLLYARASTAYSPATGKAMIKYTDAQIVSLILKNYRGRKCILLSPLVKGRKGNYKELFASMLRRGYSQVRIDGSLRPLSELQGGVDRYKVHFVELVVDKLVPKEEDEKRIRDSVQTALNYGKGSLSVLDVDSDKISHFSKHFICPESGISFPEPAPHTFSFNSPQGACPHCKGLGMIESADISKIIPDDSLSIAEGGIEPIGDKKNNALFTVLESIAKKYKFSLSTPIKEIPEEVMDLILYGSDELFRVDIYGGVSEMVSFPGVIAKISHKEEDSDEMFDKKDQFTQEVECPVCHGTRLKEDSLCFKIDGKNIAEVSDMDVSELYAWICTLNDKLDSKQRTIASDILKELRDRVGFLLNVGLSYLSLSRATRSLSGGESQRIRLATQIGSKLVNVLYILDEPSIGLHQSDNIKLIASLKKLRDEGNSVMVVEHDEEMMRSADWLIDIGPGAGEKGGEVLYCGEPSGIKNVEGSYTADYLTRRRKIEVPAIRRVGNGKVLELKGASGNNLKKVDISIPLGCLVGVSGLSGSGKSSLINETLMPILSNQFYHSRYKPLPYRELTGIENIDKLIEIDQSPIGRSPRSNPATYTGVFTDIRKLFAETPDAKIRGFKSGIFSFNVKGGRCEVCKGAGMELIEMNFLPSVQVTCKECHGKRYKSDILAVKYKGKNINDVLEMTISQAVKFFEPIPSIYRRIKSLDDVGLGYIKLGQSSLSLSGGENQRVKLAAELSKSNTGNTLFILDEPTTGLHSEDIKVLLSVLQKLVDQGNTVIIIEHNLDVLKSVDYLFDMGPEGGRNGGYIISKGTPEQVAADPKSSMESLLDVLH
jgi:excinuclease ABC subunit A